MGASYRSNLPRLAKAAHAKALAAVHKAAFDIQANAQSYAPVDTGALRASVGVDTSTGALSAIVSVGVDYGEYVEFGTSRAGAQPFLIPAVEDVRPAFEAAMRQVGQ
jgi:HK97 gp10 family phage protein